MFLFFYIGKIFILCNIFVLSECDFSLKLLIKLNICLPIPPISPFKSYLKPVNWVKPVYMLDSDEDNNGFINEDFIVWMRTAALPTFT